uniref:Methyltransferase domain-containing protein n=1 Tax=Biomphalaria glabrata TaxID=6526 RepID=A0A2C9M419_BIOGL
MIDWYWNSPVEYKCTDIVAVGNYDICQDSRFIIKPSCLVYSFGIDFRYSFDDAMSNLGCEVHSFDPSMGVETHKRANNSTFHNIGISHSNNDSFAPRQDKFVKTPQVWKMRTLQTLMKELGHEEKVIDVLKLDIEGYEWTVIDNLIETNVIKNIRQFVMEIHIVHEWPAKADYVHLYQIHTKLREMGFQKFTVRPYSKVLVEGYYANQVEISFVNVLFQPR